jgi:ParB-like chromosome segregation protein Spo0J
MSPQEMARRIETWPLERLRPYERNPCTHSEQQIAKIAASIQEYGFTNPILVDAEQGIVAGHGRLAAARLLDLAEVPVIELTHLTPDQVRAYRLADNRLAREAGQDAELLALELKELDLAGYNLALTGFDEPELEELLRRGALGVSPPAEGGPEAPRLSGERAVFRVSCPVGQASALAGALERAVRASGIAGVELARI